MSNKRLSLDTGPARLPALPPVSGQDSSMRTWMQAVAERLEVREGARGNAAERVVTQRELEAAVASGKSNPTGTSWLDKYRSIDDLGDALKDTTMYADLQRRIARLDGEPEGSVGGSTATTGTQRTVAPPDTLRLIRNDLDFYFPPKATSTAPSTYQEFVCTVNTAGFFTNGGDHLVFAVDCSGESGNGHPHWGPIVRNGRRLFEYARGFIVFGDGRVYAEHWNGTFSPGVALVANTVPGGFSPATTPMFTVRVTAGYRVGAMAEYMSVNIHRDGATGPIVFSAAVPWGWDWTGTHQACFGAIGPGFISPNATGNVETGSSGAAPWAYVPFSGAKLTAM